MSWLSPASSRNKVIIEEMAAAFGPALTVNEKASILSQDLHFHLELAPSLRSPLSNSKGKAIHILGSRSISWSTLRSIKNTEKDCATEADKALMSIKADQVLLGIERLRMRTDLLSPTKELLQVEILFWDAV